MKILIVGGTGTMGSELTDILSADPRNEVVVISRHKHESSRNKRFLAGNALSKSFMANSLKERFDAIVDFMWHDEISISNLLPLFLQATGQYFFLSSAAVYAPSDKPLREDSPRFLDVCKPVSKSNGATEYHLLKAQTENIVRGSRSGNWTIIRPHIIFNRTRLPLCTWEKGIWLPCALNGLPIALPEDVLGKRTTLTHGRQIAKQISNLIGNRNAIGETFNLGSETTYTWGEIKEVYDECLYSLTGKKLLMFKSSADEISRIIPSMRSRFSCDRLLDRTFDLSKYKSVTGDSVLEPTTMNDALSKCMEHVLKMPYCNMANIADFDAIRANGRITGHIPSSAMFKGRDKIAFLLRSNGFPDRLTTCAVYPGKALRLSISLLKRSLKWS